MIVIEIQEDEFGLPHITEKNMDERELGAILFPNKDTPVSLEDVIGEIDPAFYEMEIKDAVHKLIQHSGLTPLELATLRAIYWNEPNSIKLLHNSRMSKKRIERLHKRALTKLRRKAFEWRLFS